jgi:galactokinase
MGQDELPVRAAVLAAFRKRFGTKATWLVRAPGRVNLIGEHTDYNDGFVLPLAIERAVWIALRPRDDDRILAHSLDFPEQPAGFALDEVRRETPLPGNEGWVEYVKGVAWALHNAGYPLHGWEGSLAGDVPVGAGLSSSAALEMAVARAFAAAGDFPWDAAAMARAGQRAENEWVGVNCGIMDQMISAAAVAGQALLIDCRTLETTPAPLPPQTVIVILDTMTRRGLVDSAYNERREQCEQAAAFFEAPALRDVALAAFELRSGDLAPLPRRRARHVITENERVLRSVAALVEGNARQAGLLMNASHASLRDDFEVSSEALDAMVACAQGEDGAHGARMTGAGFGGCAVALVDAAAAEAFVAAVTACYTQRTGTRPAVYITGASAGASCERLS